MLRYRTLYLPLFVFYIEWKSFRLELLTSIHWGITKLFTCTFNMNLFAESRRRPFFCAKVTSTLGEISGKIPFDYVIAQQGTAYDSTTSIFTAPGEGHYVFYTNIVAPAEKYCQAQITKNGVCIAGFISDSKNANEYHMGGNMAVMHLMTADKVWIQTYACQGIYIGGSWYNAGYTSVFIGFKIL